jgi:general secretion pathway protein E
MVRDGNQDGDGFGPYAEELQAESAPVSHEGDAYAGERAPEADGFGAASEQELASDLALEPAVDLAQQLTESDLYDEPAVRNQPLIGEILVQMAGITVDQVAVALEAQEVDGGRIGEILLRSRVITEEQLLKGLSAQIGVEFAEELQPDDVDVDLLETLPIGYVKTQRCLPIRRQEDGTVLMATGDPLNVTAMDDVRTVLGAEVQLVTVSPARIMEVINTVYTRRGDAVELGDGEEFSEGDAEELIDIIDLDDEAPIIRWVNSLMFNAAKERASDIHIEPGEKDVVVRNRIDGVLYETKHAHKQYLPSIVARVKIMSGLNIAEKRLPQDGRIRRKIAGRDIDMRVATIPTARGERVTIRLLDRTAVLLNLADIGMGPDHLEQVAEVIRRPHGILMVTGPTGSGKTTTLYSALSQINTPDKNILTVEDPVEYQLDGISQVQVNSKIDLTFANGLRSFLRHDPDVIMVGEIRDLETAEIAIQASLTGHLVFSTVHTNDSAGAITRLVDMGVEPFLVASSLSALLAQRLVRRLCTDCREVYEPDYEEIRNLNLEPEAFFAGAIPPHPTTEKDGAAPPPGRAFRATGCSSCLNTGYSGRLGIYELLMLDDNIRNLALKNTDAVTVKRAAINAGMRTLRDDGARKVVAGLTSIAEIMRVTQEDVG